MNGMNTSALPLELELSLRSEAPATLVSNEMLICPKCRTSYSSSLVEVCYRDGEKLVAHDAFLAAESDPMRNVLIGGKYRIPIPLATCTLAITHADGRAVVTETFAYAQTEGMVGLGERMLTAGARVQGTVQMPDGSPAIAAAVVLRHQGLERRVLTGTDGVFAVAGLIAVDYELQVLPVPGCVPLVHTLAVSGSGQIGSELRLVAEVPLSNMFGFATDLRSGTQGKGNFTMEFAKYGQVPVSVQTELITKYKDRQK